MVSPLSVPLCLGFGFASDPPGCDSVKWRTTETHDREDPCGGFGVRFAFPLSCVGFLSLLELTTPDV